MSIFKSIKEWLYPPLHDPYGEYVKKKVENCNKDFKNGLEFPKDKLPYVQKCLKDAGYKVVIKDEVDDKKFPSKRTINRLLGRRDNMSCDNYNEAGDPTKQQGITDWIEGNKTVKSSESLYVQESAQGYSTDEFINRDKKSEKVDNINSYNAILRDNHKLKMENIDLKNEVDYYEKYIKFIEENYILVLKSPSFLKETFDEMVGDKNE